MIRFGVKPPHPPKTEWTKGEIIILFLALCTGLALFVGMIYFFPPPQK